jgi:hypothetical protein
MQAVSLLACLTLTDRLLQHRLHIDVTMSFSVFVPRPLLISDDQVDDPTKLTSIVSEWAYIDAKITFTDLLVELNNLVSVDTTPLDTRLSDCQQCLNTYWDRLPDSLRQTFDDPRQPPWVFAQACVMAMGFHEAVMELYRPHLAVEVTALQPCLLAAQAIISAAQRYVQHILFRWIDAQPDSCWTFGSKVFRAGIIIAFVILADLENDQTTARMSAVETAIGLLRSTINGPIASSANENALASLLQVRSWISNVDRDAVPDHIIE